MIHHNVLFKFKAETPQEAKDLIIEKLEALTADIPEIEMLKVGSNFSERGKGFEMMLVSTFADHEALAAYGRHPKHLEVIATYIKPHLEDIVVGDIEI